MKEGEEEKTKSYTALVWTQKPIQSEDLAFIDDIKVTKHTEFDLKAAENCMSKHRLKSVSAVDPSGSDSGPEDPSEGFAPACSGRPSAGRPQYERPLPGLSSLLPGPEDAGRDVSSQLRNRILSNIG